MIADPYGLAALEAALAGTAYEGKLHHAAVTESTNTDALEAARAGAPHGSVWVADEQLAGRGRGGHGWHSSAGEGLYVSVLLRPELPARWLPLVPLAAGLAAAEAIRAVTALTIDLRWPNDLLLNERKAGGILVETRSSSKGLPHAVVVGIGINVHQRAFAPDLATPATSLALESPHPISRQSLLIALLESLQRETLALAEPQAREGILSRIEASSTWLRGRRVQVHGPQACTGTTDGLDHEGFLRVLTAQGLVIVQTGGIRAA